MFTPVTEEHISFFSSILNDRCLIDKDALEKYSHDETEDLSVCPEVVLKPNSPEEVSAINKTKLEAFYIETLQ